VRLVSRGAGEREELAPRELLRALGGAVGEEAADETDERRRAGVGQLHMLGPRWGAVMARVAAGGVGVGVMAAAWNVGDSAGRERFRETRGNPAAARVMSGLVGVQGDSVVKTKKFGSDVMLGAAAAASMTVGALAGDAVQWRVEDGGNGHWYQRTEATCWSEAESAARAHGGHLASVLSAGEAQFCTQFVRSESDGITVAIGGFRSPTSDLYLGWRWTTDETFILGSLTWMAGNPGCCGPDEYFLGINRVGHIGDLRDCPGLVGAILEWSADCNADGIVDYGQILAGTLADTNANGIPDSCECTANPGLPACCIGDIVADRVINGADLGTLLAYWGTRTSGSFSIASDLNNDGRIDGSDLGILLAYWGACPTANVPAWATLLETQPDPAVVTDAALRAAIAATGLPWRVRDTGTGIEMLLAPPGTFEMGCSQRSTAYDCYSSELPVHQVNLMNAFYIGRYEVTQAQWFAKMGSNPSQFQGATDAATRPVEKVSWTAIQSYLTSTNMRLPTEAEWEFACRAGTNTPFYNGSSDDSTIGALAWYNDNSGGQTHSVGGKAPNALGLHDMLGNVWEWVNDWYGSYSTSTETDPAGPTSGTLRCIRGGAWFDPDTRYLRSSSRGGFSPQFFDTNIGFRVARNP